MSNKNIYFEMTSDKAYKQDVKSMSYDELMDVVRYLDAEKDTLLSVEKSILKKPANNASDENADNHLLRRSA